MLNAIRNSVFSRLLWGIVAIYLLNISIDTADPDPEVIANYSQLNPQESFAEILLEKVLNFEDAFAEHDDHENEDHDFKRLLRLELIHLSQSKLMLPITRIAPEKQFFSDLELNLPAGYSGNVAPPPRV